MNKIKCSYLVPRTLNRYWFSPWPGEDVPELMAPASKTMSVWCDHDAQQSLHSYKCVWCVCVIFSGRDM